MWRGGGGVTKIGGLTLVFVQIAKGVFGFSRKHFYGPIKFNENYIILVVKYVGQNEMKWQNLCENARNVIK